MKREKFNDSVDETYNFEWSDLSKIVESNDGGGKSLSDEFVPISEFRAKYKKRVEEKYMNGEKL